MSKKFTFIFIIILCLLFIFVKQCTQNRNKDVLKYTEQETEKSLAIEPEDSTPQPRVHEIPFETTNHLNETVEDDQNTFKLNVVDDLRGNEDTNGVRQDINAWIHAQNITDNQKRSLMQMAKSLQKNIVMSKSIKSMDFEAARQEAKTLATSIMKAMKCIREQFNDESEPYKLSYTMEALILNTPERLDANKTIDQALNGAAIVFPEGESCEE